MNSSLGRKYLMAGSAFFLLVFLLQHFLINMLSVISPDAFNSASHFMGTNPLIQYTMQPVLIFGVVFHFVMGFILELKNKSARPVAYAHNKPGANSSWMSRNMIYSGMVILLFIGLHFYDFWIPEIKYKYIDMLASDTGRYFPEVREEFENPIRVGLYCLAFIFLGLHLLHGFQSAFQSMGLRHNKYTPIIKKLGTAYAILIPAGFIFIAVFHFLNAH